MCGVKPTSQNDSQFPKLSETFKPTRGLNGIAMKGHNAGHDKSNGEESDLVKSCITKTSAETQNLPTSTADCSYNYSNRIISDQRLKEIVNTGGIKSLEFVACKFTGKLIEETLVTCIKGGLEWLVLSGSKISGKHLQFIAKNIPKNYELKVLDLSHIPLDESGADAVSSIIFKAKSLERLNLHDCDLDKNSLKKLSEKKATEKMKTLILSSNPEIAEDVKLVADLIDKFSFEEIDISANCLTSDHITKLISTKVQVSTLHVRENPFDDWGTVGSLVKNWKVKYLDASECRMHLEDCKDFVFSIDKYQLEELNVYHPDRTKSFAEITRECLMDSAKFVIVDAKDFTRHELSLKG